MRKIASAVIITLLCLHAKAQEPWILQANEITKDNYYGVSVGNGMLGLVFSAEPLKLK